MCQTLESDTCSQMWALCPTCSMNSSRWSIIIFWGGPYKKNILIIALEISDAETSHKGKIIIHFVNKSVTIIAYTWLLSLAWKGPMRSTVTTLHGFPNVRRCCWGPTRTVFFATWQCWQAYTYRDMTRKTHIIVKIFMVIEISFIKRNLKQSTGTLYFIGSLLAWEQHIE